MRRHERVPTRSCERARWCGHDGFAPIGGSNAGHTPNPTHASDRSTCGAHPGIAPILACAMLACISLPRLSRCHVAAASWRVLRRRVHFTTARCGVPARGVHVYHTATTRHVPWRWLQVGALGAIRGRCTSPPSGPCTAPCGGGSRPWSRRRSGPHPARTRRRARPRSE